MQKSTHKTNRQPKMPVCSKLSDSADPPRKLKTYRLLLAAARKLFAERGYHETTAHDISEAAGVVDGTFYAHFEDKLDCFLAFMDDISNECCQVVNYFMPPPGSPPAEVIHAQLSASFSYSQANPGLLRAMYSDVGVLSKDRRIKLPHMDQQQIKDIVDSWKETGQASPDFDSKLFIHLLASTVRQGSALVARNPRSEKRITEQMIRFLVCAIQADPEDIPSDIRKPAALRDDFVQKNLGR